jgi:hypothetical protein
MEASGADLGQLRALLDQYHDRSSHSMVPDDLDVHRRMVNDVRQHRPGEIAALRPMFAALL